MDNTDPSQAKQIDSVIQSLITAGWRSSDILREPAIRTSRGTARPSLALTYALYPLATLDVASTGSDGSTQDAENLFESFPISLETDGESTWQRGAKSGTHWRPVPAPSDLWSLLGRTWDKTDPRIVPQLADVTLHVQQIAAIGSALDAFESGKHRVQLVMPQGTGKTLIATEIVWKLLSTGRRRKILFLTFRRVLAEQHFQRLRSFPPPFVAALLPDAEMVAAAPVHVATTAYFLLPNRMRLETLPPDTYDLIVITDVLEQPESFQKIVQHFAGANVLAFSAVPHSDTSFGAPAFQLTIDDILAMEAVQIPPGYRPVRLGDISIISAGANPATNTSAQGIPLLSARDLPLVADGHAATADAGRSLAKHQIAAGLDVLHEKDILVPSILNPTAPRVSLVPENTPGVPYHSSVYRIRITDPSVRPDDVFRFLTSDAGIRSIQRTASFMGGHVRVTARDLAQVQVLLPQSPQREARERTEEGGELTTEPESSLTAAGQALRQLNAVVLPDLQALEADAQSRDSMVISARLREIAAMIAPPPLAERVMARYPMPIALAYRRFHDARFNVYEQVLRLRDLFESVAFFVYNAVLADSFRRLSPSKYAVPDKSARTAYDGASMAYRIGFVEGIAGIAKAGDSNELFMPALCTSTFCTDARRLQSDFRNHISHSATASESRQRALLAKYQPVVESMLAGLEFLEDFRLARISSLYVRSAKFIRRVELYQGVTPAVDEQEFDLTSQPELAEHDHLVLLDENDEHLDLFPMYQFVANEQTGDDTHMCCLKFRRGKELHGESVQAPLDVTLGGAVVFEALRSRQEAP